MVSRRPDAAAAAAAETEEAAAMHWRACYSKQGLIHIMPTKTGQQCNAHQSQMQQLTQCMPQQNSKLHVHTSAVTQQASKIKDKAQGHQHPARHTPISSVLSLPASALL
jgi:hypothetical protein